MNNRRITSSWNNHRDLEYFDEGGGGERGRSMSRTHFSVAIPAAASLSRPRRQAETLVGKSIELEDENEDSCDDDDNNGAAAEGGLSFRDKRMLLARKRMDATVSSSKGVTLGVGGYATKEYSSTQTTSHTHVRSSSVSRAYDTSNTPHTTHINTHNSSNNNNMRSASVSRVHDSLGLDPNTTPNTNNNAAAHASSRRQVSSRVIPTPVQTDFVEVALENRSVHSTGASKSPRQDAQSLSPVHDDVSSLGSTGSGDAYSSRSWLPPKLKSRLSPTSIAPTATSKQKTTPTHLLHKQHSNDSGSSPESLNVAHPPKYVSATTRSSDRYILPPSQTEDSTITPTLDSKKNNTNNTNGKSDFLSFERAQKAKALRRSRLAHHSTPSTVLGDVSSEPKVETKEESMITSHNSTTATVTTSSTAASSLPSSIMKTKKSKTPDTVVTNIPLIQTSSSSPRPVGNYVDMDDERSIKSSVTTYTYQSCASENANAHSAGSMEHSRMQRRRRRKIALIHHVLTCTHPPPLVTSSTSGSKGRVSEEYVPCPQLKCCYALSILIRHAQTCTFVSKDGVEQCDVPSCLDYKKAWLHFRRCALARSTGKRQFCLLCSDVSLPSTTTADHHYTADMPTVLSK